MSELDDAIREHLELKRRHGARDAEVKQLEDEAFGTGERPADPFSAADQLLRSGEEGEQEGPDAGPMPAEQGTPTDVPPPETPPPASYDPVPDAPSATDEGVAAEHEVLPATSEAQVDAEAASDAAAAAEPVTGAPPIPPPPPPRTDRDSEVVQMPTEEHPAPGPPSEEFAVDAEPASLSFEEAEPPPVDESPGVEAPPLEEPPVEEPAQEPPVEEPPLEEPPVKEPQIEEPDDAAGEPVLYDFEADGFAEPAAPAEPAPAESVPAESPEPPPAAEVPVEDDPDDLVEAGSEAGEEDAFADLGPADSVPIPAEADDFDDLAEADADPGPGAVTADTSEREAIDATEQYPVPDQQPPPFEPAPTTESEPDSGSADEPTLSPADDESEDLLEETPDFLEEKEDEDEDLWFERRPPKDFDFDD